MARGTPPSAGFQLALPDSEKFSSPADKAQNNQQNHGQQNNGGHSSGQQQSTQGNAQSAHTQSTAPANPDGNQYPQQPQMQGNNHHAGQHVQGNSPNQQHVQAAHGQNVTAQGNPSQQEQASHGHHHNNSHNVQASNGQHMVVPDTPGRQKQQAMMHTPSHNNQQVAHGYSGNDQQHIQATQAQNAMGPYTPGGHSQQHHSMVSSNLDTSQQAGEGHNGSNHQQVQMFNDQILMGQCTPDYQQHQAVMGRNPMANQQMHFPQGVMYTNNCNPQPAHGNSPNNFQHALAYNGQNVMAPGSANAQQYPGFIANSNFQQFPQGNTGNPVFHQQQQGQMIPGSLLGLQPGIGYMPKNNMDGQQGNMVPMPAMEQFQHPLEFQNIVQDVHGQRLPMQMVNHMNQMQQQQAGAPSTVISQPKPSNSVEPQPNQPMHQPTQMHNPLGNQNAVGSLGA
jgi:hypothetical protein